VPFRQAVEEESVDQYMARLMDRIRSVRGDLTPTSTLPPPAEPARVEGEGRAVHCVAAPPKPQAAAEREPVERSPRTVAPERQVNMSALRELANLSAHSAISQHTQRVLIRTMRSKLIVAAVALLASGGLWWMWSFFGAREMTYYSALVAILVAIYWGVEYALLTGRLIISKSGHIDWNLTSHGKSKSPPVEEGAEKTPAELPGPSAAAGAESASIDLSSDNSAAD
jgi:hypothetical protein